MSDPQWRLPSMTPRDLLRWGTAVFVLVIYGLIITTIVLALFGVFP